MLLEFTIKNYKSFKNPVTLSMLASSLKEHRGTHVFEEHKYNLLKSTIIYGANASGKSNLFKAILFMKKFVFSSAKDTQITDQINIEHFKLSTETINKPSLFEIVFLINKIRYRYGFLVNEDGIEAEWLFYVPTTKEARLFIREDNKIHLGPNFKEGKGIREKTRKNALFLSVSAQFNGQISSKILNWFRQLNIISGLNDRYYMGYTIEKLQDPQFKQWALNYLRSADQDILDVQIDSLEVDIENLPKEFQGRLIDRKISIDKVKSVKSFLVNTHHQKYDNNKDKVDIEVFDVKEHESKGTQKILALAGPVWDTLQNGKILFIDEFDARLHQNLTLSLIKLFNSSKSNSRKAQFILATHDANLLRNDLFRRDQIWFINKDRYGISDLYSLAEYKKSSKTERKDASYSKNYLMGKYGAIPILDDFEELFEVKDG